MKQRFTKLLAAVALLVFMMPSMVGWGQTTATISSFSETSGDIDQNISYAAYKGGASNAPYISNGTLRIYKPSSGGTGGYVTITAATGYEMSSVTITNSNDKSGTIKYSVDGGDLSSSINLSTNEAYTVNDLTASSISFYNTGSDRFSIAGFTVIYIDGGTPPTPVQYTVTLNDTGATLTETSTGSGVTLPSRDDVPPYTFAGWSTTNIPTEITSAPTIIPVGLYYPSSDITLYPIYTRTESSGSTTTEWHLTELSAADAGTYALLTTDYHAFNGNISSGHGQVTQDAFEFTNNVATSAPSSICEITFEAVTGGFKMKNDATSTYLYASKASSGGLAWHDSEDSYWKNDDNWVYNQNSARLRSYSNNSFRTYSTNNGYILKLAKKVTVSGGTTYYVSVVATITSLTCTGTPTTTSYYEGDSFDPTGLTVTAIFDDNSTSDVTSLVTWTPDPLTVGNTTVTGTYMSFSVTVEGITVNEIPDYAELPFVWNGGSSTDFAALFGTTIHGNGTDYTAHAPYLIKLDSDGDYIQVKTDSQPGAVTIGVKMVGGAQTSTIKVQGSSDGTTFDEGEVLTISGDQNNILTLTSTRNFSENVRYVRLYFTRGSNVGVGPITIYKGSLDVNGHGGKAGNWYLIASPLTENTAPTDINGLVASDGHYDLYRFNQNPTVTNNDYLEWENYKIHSNDFVLENGKGYLYASQASTTLYFNGECNTGDTKTVDLDYSETNPDVNMRGWNLVGNPFTTVAYANHSYFVMDGNGTSIVATPVSYSTAINPFTGVFVQATATNQSVTFSKTARGTTNNKGVINLALSQQVNRGSAMVDKAVVSFNEGDQLGKFVFMESNAKLYIPQNGKDYAIVNSEAQGEMPVNFKASANGTYTMAVNPEGVELNYLHLIDNMTGMDVDLLQTPSYTFDATTNDYASRFRLVFSANNVDGPSTGSETFAFYSNGNWVIGNEGEATLQVIDVNGRIVSNETINGTVATSINATPGVYMLRLVNGNEVKTQKIVVR